MPRPARPSSIATERSLSGPEDLGGGEEQGRRFSVGLFIIHPAIDPAEITLVLGLEPQDAWRAGDSRPQGGAWPDTRWRHARLYRSSGDRFAGPLTSFIAALLPHRAYFLQLQATGGQVFLDLNFLGDGYLGDVIPAHAIAMLAEMNIAVGIDIFMVPQHVSE